MRSSIFAFVALSTIVSAQIVEVAPCESCQMLTDACGNEYGGCFNSCDSTFDETYPAPACDAPTITPAPTTSTTSASCTPSSICVDKMNSCYMRYGGCIDANYCNGTSTISTPTCPTMTTMARKN